MERGFLDYFALGILVMITITGIYAIIYIHDIPYEIAKKRNHPHQDAIHTAGWVSLFLMHTIWPFLWIWATLYKPETGWGTETVEIIGGDESSLHLEEEISGLQQRVAALEEKLGQQKEEV